MASGISSALGYYNIGLQSAKGAVATVFFKYRASGEPSIQPVKTVERYHMTDTGRDGGDAYLSVVQVTGDLPMYMQPDGAALIWYAVLGAFADSGAGPNWTHTITPADDVPWLTIQRVVGGVITEQFVDCKLNTLALVSEAGDAPQYTASFIGITPTWAAAALTPTAIVGAPLMHWEGKQLYMVNAVDQRIHRLSLEVTNGLTPYQADDYFLSDVDPGTREVTFSYSMHFTSPTAEPKYREFMYGSDAGTTVSTVLPEKPVSLTWRRNANTEVNISLPEVRSAAVPVNPNPSGEAIDVEVATIVEKPLASPVMTVVVKDQTATIGA
jgi:hypothetical protein